MFESNFNFKNDKEMISEEIRRLVEQSMNSYEVQCEFDETNNYLTIWKSNLLKLSGDN